MRTERNHRKYNNYMKRTLAHIHRVQNNMLKIVTDFKEDLQLSDEDCRILMHSVLNHDRSKFSKKQFYAYVELTELYHQRRVLGNTEYDYDNPEIRTQVEEAVADHYEQENHHPERLQAGEKFHHFEAMETFCDLQAMAEEFNEGSCRNFYENVWKKKQVKYFSDDFNWFSTTTTIETLMYLFERHYELNS